MAFDLDRLVEYCVKEIRRFALDHTDEVFYAFAIDENLLCLNSEEAAEESLNEYRERWERRNRPLASWQSVSEEDFNDAEFLLSLHEKHSGLDRSDHAACLAVMNESRKRAREKGNPYLQAEQIKELRENTGDWAYQGFAEMSETDGFDMSAYEDHYYMDEKEQLSSAYGVAMDKVLRLLVERNAFSDLTLAPDFVAVRVEHDY